MAMEMKKNLPKGTMFTVRGLGHSAKKSEAMKRLMQNKTIAGALDKSVERKEFYNLLKKESGGKSVKKDDVRKVLGYLRKGRGENINKSEAQKIAGQIFNGSYEKKYIYSSNDKKAESSTSSLLLERQERKERKEMKEKNSPMLNPKKETSVGASKEMSSHGFKGRPISKGNFISRPNV